MKKLLVLTACVFAALLNVASAQVLTLQPLTTFGTNGDGSIFPGQITGTSLGLAPSNVVTFTGDGAERAIAYNPTTGHLLVVQRTNAFSANYHVYVLDGMTGTNILDVNSNCMELDLSGASLSGGNLSFIYSMIGISDDGGIYVVNLSNSPQVPQVNIYYWPSETAARLAVFADNPGAPNTSSLNRRWGDTFVVRGSGANTQILMASRGSTMSILTPPPSGTPDWLFNPFQQHLLQTDVPLTVGMGFGLCFGPGNTIYSKAAAATGSPLVRLSFDLNSPNVTNAVTQQTYSLTNFSGRVGNMNVLAASNLMVAVEPVAGNDFVRLYDISNPSSFVELDRKTYNTNAANNLFAASVAFGSNSVVYALDVDNGIRAFTLTSVPVNNLSPSFILQPQPLTVFPNNLGVLPTNAAFTSAADGDPTVTYQWYQGTSATNATNVIPGATNTTYNFANPQLTDNGKTFAVIATNNYGAATSSVVVLGVSSTIPVSLPWYEPFNYPIGTLSTNGNWVVQSGASGNVAAGSLSTPWIPAPNGNLFSWLNGTMSHRLPFGTYASGTVYYSIMLKIPDLAGLNTANNATPGTLCGFASGSGTSFMKLMIITNGAGQYSLGCGFAGNSGAFETNLHNVNDTVLVVQSYTFGAGAGGTDLSTLWINPDPSTFSAANPPPATCTFSGGISTGSFDRFFFRHSGANQPATCYADELRLGLTWADVVPQAPPTLNVAYDGTNAVLSWPTLASGYAVQASPSVSPTAWTSVTNAASVVGTNNVVKVRATNQARFFELIK